MILSSSRSLAFMLLVRKCFKPTQLSKMKENSFRSVLSQASCRSTPGRTLLPQLQTGLNDPPKQSALAMVNSIKCSHSPLVCSQPVMNVMEGWFCRTCPLALRRTSQESENQGEIQTQPFPNWSSGVAERSRNAIPEVVD